MRFDAARGWRNPQTAAHGNSFFPAIAVAGDRPVIAFQDEGLHCTGRGSQRWQRATFFPRHEKLRALYLITYIITNHPEPGKIRYRCMLLSL